MVGANNTDLPAINVGEIVECTVEQIMPYGAFVRITKSGRKGMIHISELSYSFVKNISDVLNIGDNIQAKVIKIDEKGRIDLSLKQTQEPPVQQQGRPPRRFSGRENREKAFKIFMKCRRLIVKLIRKRLTVSRRKWRLS